MAAATEKIIRFEKVSKAFNHQVVLRDLDLRIERGMVTVVIGPSGCGKTVLLKHVVGLIHPDSGHVFFENQDVTKTSERDLVPIRRRIAYIFQSNALFDSMSVIQNVQFPLVELGVDETQQHERAETALRMVGLEDTMDKMPEELSGGQKKRVALARGIVIRPEVILYDEPTTGLDPIRADLINELILKLQRELHTTALVVTHDMDSARKIADRIVMLFEGRILADTTPENLKNLKNEVAIRFVEGRATQEELERLSFTSSTGNGQ
jgi:phospholipid/cholesterol/gamma-HCH transport system ATP-binding protein